VECALNLTFGYFSFPFQIQRWPKFKKMNNNTFCLHNKSPKRAWVRKKNQSFSQTWNFQNGANKAVSGQLKVQATLKFWKVTLFKCDWLISACIDPKNLCLLFIEFQSYWQWGMIKFTCFFPASAHGCVTEALDRLQSPGRPTGTIHTSFIIFPHGGFLKTIWYNTTTKYQCTKMNNIRI